MIEEEQKIVTKIDAKCGLKMHSCGPCSSVCPSACLSVRLSVRLSVCLPAVESGGVALTNIELNSQLVAAQSVRPFALFIVFFFFCFWKFRAERSDKNAAKV